MGKHEFRDDGPFIKYPDWQDVPVPLNYKSPLNEPPVLGSPVQAPERTRSEHEGILDRMYNMYSPTFLNVCPNQLVSFPRHPDHNFFIWANPDNIVHRYDEGLRSWQIMYSSFEYIEEYIDRYGTNMYKDFSHLAISIDDLPSPILVPKPGLDHNPVPEPDIDSTSRLSLSS